VGAGSAHDDLSLTSSRADAFRPDTVDPQSWHAVGMTINISFDRRTPIEIEDDDDSKVAIVDGVLVVTQPDGSRTLYSPASWLYITEPADSGDRVRVIGL
jgi:hypothetical protein